MLIEFTDAEEIQRWIAINDDVMGSHSHIRIELLPAGTALFSGQLALENNGGFASIRRRSDEYNLGAYSGVMVKVQGDGRTYQFRVKTDDQYDGVAYRTLFTPNARQWQTITLPFADFSASFRGKPVAGAPVLKPEQIKQIGFLFVRQTSRTISSPNSLDKVVFSGVMKFTLILNDYEYLNQKQQPTS